MRDEELTVHRLKVKKGIAPYIKLNSVRAAAALGHEQSNKSLEVVQQRRGGDRVPECSLGHRAVPHMFRDPNMLIFWKTFWSIC